MADVVAIALQAEDVRWTVAGAGHGLCRHRAAVTVLVHLTGARDGVAAPADRARGCAAGGNQWSALAGRRGAAAVQRALVLPAVARHRRPVDHLGRRAIGAHGRGLHGAAASIGNGRALVVPAVGFGDRAERPRVRQPHRRDRAIGRIRIPSDDAALAVEVPVVAGQAARHVVADQRRGATGRRIAAFAVERCRRATAVALADGVLDQVAALRAGRAGRIALEERFDAGAAVAGVAAAGAVLGPLGGDHGCQGAGVAGAGLVGDPDAGADLRAAAPRVARTQHRDHLREHHRCRHVDVEEGQW